ncbi:ABC transporter permease [Demequina zhanjiangensis]|uniref:Iron chelate uptake ABC transporter family permease subunit n=1 Tax=Demequina zhanjiangensis TaxID=3051659 RepID=A0ABT8FZ07_9MICO|nr:iron chelate uptake ABC transporter family permease subunit [Demequina sp. SYSU T00b26]MDN4472131.1 iron chelate uptake ABC transporter family permease subunit [Demequina sp. SYSU T00b26]
MAVAAVGVLSVVSLAVGAAGVGLGELVGSDEGRSLLTLSRWPRTAALILSGAALAVAGLIMQQLTRNRFVAPSTAGTVDAATLGVLTSLLFFASAPVMGKVLISTAFALAGTAVFVVLIQRVQFKDVVFVPLVGLLLGGVYRAIAEFVAYREGLTQSLSVWTNGDFSGIIQGRYETLWLAGAAAVLAYAFAHHFSAAGMGRDFATGIGVDVRRVTALGLSIAAFTTAVVVVTAGAIPFLGLIVPNLVTMAIGDNLRRTLPVTAMAGAALTLACDILGRLLIFPYEIPIGSIAGVLGAVIFAALVLRKGNRYAHA